jgi:uncharacterized secreted protein with C-terminal beta-propeller domain
MRRPLLLTGAAALAAALAACTSPAQPAAKPQPRPAPALELVAYDSCDELLSELRTAAKANVQPWGFGNSRWLDFGFASDARAASGAEKAAAPGPAYSGTNNHELGVDEPDMVKTDGRRIVTIARNELRVIDAASHKVTGTVQVSPMARGGADQLLLNGDHVLVIGSSWDQIPVDNRRAGDAMKPVGPMAYLKTGVWLVDISGAPKIISSYTIDGSYADARQSGTVARIVVRSTPRIEFPADGRGTQKELIAANRKIIDKAPVSAWLPAYTSDGEKGQVDCGDVSRPHTYSGTSMVTVLSFDLTRDRLGTGIATSLVADGDTVYGSGNSLYIAHDERWRGQDAKSGTDIFQFDISAMQPVYVAGGTVPGWLLNQYALSEYNGVLRAATTDGQPWQPSPKSTSTVYALRDVGGRLKVVGQVGGLGKNEQIYAVRFAGPVGYVVTFRRTDPLYAIDLADPEHPKVAGELKIPGYSAYLHPIADGKMLGVGQAADDNGRVQGTQVSLFDVRDLSRPDRIANYELGKNAYSEAEWDPHAFLYWPDRKLLVVPVQQWNERDPSQHRIGVALIRVDGDKLSEAGFISNPAAPGVDPNYGKGAFAAPIRRSLVIGDEIWTVSDAGVLASRLDTAQKIAWLPN